MYLKILLLFYQGLVPAWWCQALDSSMHLVEWPMRTVTAGMILINKNKEELVALKWLCIYVFLIQSLYCLIISRPVVVIGGSSDKNQDTSGAFQEFPQVLFQCLFMDRLSIKKSLYYLCIQTLLFITIGWSLSPVQ